MARTDSFENIQKTLDLAGQELRILHQISSTISSTLDLDEVLHQIIGLVIQVTRGDSCFLYLLDETEDFLILRASKNPHPRLIGRISVKVGEGITGWVAQESQQVAIARHASKDSRFKFFNNLPEDKFEAFLSVPIIASGRVVGVINVQHRRAHRHSEDEKTLLSIIGLQVGSAIRNARLFVETSQRSRQITTLAKVGQLIASGQYLDEMLQLIVRMIAEMMQARLCSIMLVDTQKNELGPESCEVLERRVLATPESEDRQKPGEPRRQGESSPDGEGCHQGRGIPLSRACDEGRCEGTCIRSDDLP
jgi:signal transduction protein with GAF and PtsI domain